MATKVKAICASHYDAVFANTLSENPDFELPAPDVAKNECRVNVAHTATNPIDYKKIRGDLALLGKTPFPVPVGRDFSGTIDFIPDGATNPRGLKVGDRVCGFLTVGQPSRGSFAEKLVCPLEVLAKVPENVPLRDAASVGLVANTVYHGFVDVMKCDPANPAAATNPKKVLVLGGSSATGMIALQLARALGATEIACTSSSEELCKSLGATKVINYKTEEKPWSELLAGQDFDIVYDTIGGYDGYAGACKVVKNKGAHFYTIVGDNNKGAFGVGTLCGALWASSTRGMFSGPKYHLALKLPSEYDHGVQYVIDQASKGSFRLIIDPSSPYEFTAAGAAAMFQKQASGTCKGKLVMDVVKP